MVGVENVLGHKQWLRTPNFTLECREEDGAAHEHHGLGVYTSRCQILGQFHRLCGL